MDGGTPPTTLDSTPLPVTVRSRIAQTAMDLIDAQERKGIQKYGVTLSQQPRSGYGSLLWIDMAIEESVDHLLYLIKQREHVEALVSERDMLKRRLKVFEAVSVGG